MTLYTTTDEQRVRVYEIAAAMSAAGLSKSFIASAVDLARESEGIYDLMELWSLGGDRGAVEADLQEAIDEDEDAAPGITRRRRIGRASLEVATRRVVEFKADLRLKVDKWGGISKLAHATGMPQPSLSRFFASASMPRRTTLFKIAKALDLPDDEVVFDWVA